MSLTVAHEHSKKDKVLIVSETYRWGIVEEIVYAKGKSGFKYKVRTINDNKLHTLPPEGVMPYMRKWRYRLHRWLHNVIY